MKNCWPNREGWERGDRFNGAGVGGYFLGGKTPLIKSVQRGTISITGATSNTATITSVDTANARVKWLGQTSNNGTTVQNQSMARVALTNGTTVTASVNSTPGANVTIVSYEVIEYTPGYMKSVQRGTIVGSTTATITSVDTTRSELDYLGNTQTAADGITEYQPNLILTNATTVTQSVIVSATTTSGYQAVEWNP